MGVNIGAKYRRCSRREWNWLFAERCRSGRTGRSRKPLSLLRGTEGSNPSLSASKIGLRVEHGGVGRTRPTASASKGGTQSLVDRWVNVDLDLRSEFATQPFSSWSRNKRTLAERCRPSG